MSEPKPNSDSEAIPSSPGPHTYADYERLPDDGQRWEMFDGWFVSSPSPTYGHQDVSALLHHELMNALYDTGIARVVAAPMDVVLAENVVLEPDLVVVRRERLHLITRRGIEGPPDLVVEILSSTRSRDWKEKRALYARFGVPEYWIVDPDAETVHLLRLENGALAEVGRVEKPGTITSPQFPDLAIPTSRIFVPLA